MCIPVVPAEERSIERVSSWRSPNYVETQVRLRKDWRSVLSRRFSSSIKTTNINTEEIFSVHSTSFFLLRRKYCSYSSLADTNTVKKKKNNLEAKSDCPNAVLWFSIVKTQSISWHFRTSPQQSWSTQIIEDAGKQWKAQKILLPRFVQPTNNYDLFDCWIQETIFLLSPFMLKEEKEKGFFGVVCFAR